MTHYEIWRRIVESEDWTAICSELDGMIRLACDSIDSCKTLDDFINLRERVKALKQLKTIPQDMIDRSA